MVYLFNGLYMVCAFRHLFNMVKLYPNRHTIDLVQVPRGLGLKFGLDWAWSQICSIHPTVCAASEQPI